MNNFDVLLGMKLGGGGGSSTLVEKTITANGTYNPADDNADGYSSVTANVPNTYTVADEGKVVDSGVLVGQTAKNIDANGLYDTTLNNSVSVDVPNSYTVADEGKVVSSGALVSQTAYPSTIVTNGTYDTTLNNSVTVDVPTGGGVTEKDVNFYDYDGTLVYSYTAQEFLALTELPANPTHTGLTAQGWNWSLADAKDWIQNNGSVINIGQYYVTDDGNTRIYVEIPDTTPTIYLYFRWGDITTTIDWGDGTVETVSVNNYGVAHQYATAGYYKITSTTTNFDLKGRNYKGTPDGNGWTYLINDGSGSNRPSFYGSTYIKKIEFGNGTVSVGEYGLARLGAITVTIPRNTTLSLNNWDGSSIKNVGGVYGGSAHLRFILIPEPADDNTRILSSYMLSECNALKAFSAPKSLLELPSGMSALYSLRTVPIPNTIDRLFSTYCYYNSTYIIVPANITSITGTFVNGYNIHTIKFKGVVPPVANLNSFYNLPVGCTIYVPRGYLNDYTSAAYYPNPSLYTYIEY